jgi:arsenate reductase
VNNHKSSILFLCNGNSARSIMAEAIANAQFPGQLEARSAGADPKGDVHPLALQTLEKNGISAEGLRSKSWSELANERFDLVVTLCDEAREGPCPNFPGSPRHVHWNLPDPPVAERPEDMFEAVCDALVEAIGLLVHGPYPDVTCRAGEGVGVLARRFAPRAI